jgi:hypothetical protein
MNPLFDREVALAAAVAAAAASPPPPPALTRAEIQEMIRSQVSEQVGHSPDYSLPDYSPLDCFPLTVSA